MNWTNNKRSVAGWYWYREHHYGPGWFMALMAKHTRRLLMVRPGPRQTDPSFSTQGVFAWGCVITYPAVLPHRLTLRLMSPGRSDTRGHFALVVFIMGLNKPLPECRNYTLGNP